jgi:hypothetical protein
MNNRLDFSIRLCCGLNFILWGGLKVIHVHFNQPEPFTANGSLTNLTFFYFSSSPSYVQVIGFLELLTGVFLMKKRWSPAGAYMGLAIQTNICLINLFYAFGYFVTAYNLSIWLLLCIASRPYWKILMNAGIEKSNR